MREETFGGEGALHFDSSSVALLQHLQSERWSCLMDTVPEYWGHESHCGCAPAEYVSRGQAVHVSVPAVPGTHKQKSLVIGAYTLTHESMGQSAHVYVLVAALYDCTYLVRDGHGGLTRADWVPGPAVDFISVKFTKALTV
eukprot:Colp12_sorted_trinity150504_noHs@4161